MNENRKTFTCSDYTVGWICALPESELVAAMAMLDEEHPVLPAIDPHDSNSYVLGTIGDHNVVIACLPAETTGKVSAATVAKDMVRSFPYVRFGLMVGIGGGAPYYGTRGNDDRGSNEEKEDFEDTEESDDDPEDIRDIRLGDVVISLHSKSSDAVVQYDFGKSLQEREFTHSGGKLSKPPNIVLSAVARLKAQHRFKGHNNISKTLENTILTRPALANEFRCPGSHKDYLFKSEFVHQSGKRTCKTCRSLDSNFVKRDHRPDNSPQLHYGTIGSADQVMKDALLRDKWAREESIICFEMEAAGLVDSFPCLVIRGICDYADSHKNKVWQPYAAATAACYAKELLNIIPGQGVMNMDPIKQIEENLSIVRDTVQDLSTANRRRKVLDSLPYIEGSSFDASESEHDARCHPRTRVDLLRQILEWADNPKEKCIFWLNGMAGTGKSTISRTVAQRFREKNQLGASFFFKRGEGERASTTRFFTTICTQLLLQVPALIGRVELAIDKDPYISEKSKKEQFTKLLLEPLLSLEEKEPSTIVIVIDALDECGNTDDIQTLLQLLPDVQKCKPRRICIFLTSRPELPIRPVFERSNNHQCLVLHELSHAVVEEDIRVFLRDKFSLIKERRGIPSEWPGDNILETLVKRAVPLFISAFTICRFVDDPKWVPKKRLLTLLNDPAATSGSEMDRTYLPVLKQLLCGAVGHEKQQLEQEFQDTVGVIILLATPLSVNALAQLTDKSTEDISNRLDGFYSVLSVPENLDLPVRLLHLSFQDYLLTTKESSFRVSPEKTHQKIALHCLRVMNDYKHGLKCNICDFPSYGTQHVDINRQTVNQHLSAALQYSCQYWIYHLQQSKGHVSELEIFPFLEKHFIHWLEALSLMDIMSEAVGMIYMLQRALSNSTERLTSFLYDAKRFILKNAYIARLAPLQLYSSGLVFSPMQSPVRKMFSETRPKRIRIVPQVEDHWSPGLQTLEGHSDWVWSVAFSHDSQMVASGSSDHTIKLWDAKTGLELQTLKGHLDKVWSVAFSHDSQMVASGSSDHNIKLWDAKTGLELQTLKGHLNRVWSVAFSHNSQIVASGSADHTIKLWDAKTGLELQTLKGHLHIVQSVAFSHDSQMVASGCYDNTIKLWDAKTGLELQTLKGHLDEVQSVASTPHAEKHHDNYNFQVSISDNWVTVAGENMLWLPPEHRQFTASAVTDATLALGYSDGRVEIIGFHISRLPASHDPELKS